MTQHPSTVPAALASALASDPGRPLVTFYDGATGERIELSVKTFDNWVSKIANFFSEELGLDSNAAIRIDLPTHWQSTVTLVAAWAAGLRVVLPGASTKPVATVAGPAARANPSTSHGQVVACSLRPLGGPFDEPLPPGWLDFALEVPSQPDVLLASSPALPGDVAVEHATGQHTQRDLVGQGLSTASDLGLAVGGRLVTDANPAIPPGLLAGLVAPLVVGASVVLITNMDAATRAGVAEQERSSQSFWASE